MLCSRHFRRRTLHFPHLQHIHCKCDENDGGIQARSGMLCGQDLLGSIQKLCVCFKYYPLPPFQPLYTYTMSNHLSSLSKMYIEVTVAFIQQRCWGAGGVPEAGVAPPGRLCQVGHPGTGEGVGGGPIGTQNPVAAGSVGQRDGPCLEVLAPPPPSPSSSPLVGKRFASQLLVDCPLVKVGVGAVLSCAVSLPHSVLCVFQGNKNEAPILQSIELTPQHCPGGYTIPHCSTLVVAQPLLRVQTDRWIQRSPQILDPHLKRPVLNRNARSCTHAEFQVLGKM